MKLCIWKFEIRCPDTWSQEKIDSLLDQLEVAEEKVTNAAKNLVEEIDSQLIFLTD